MTLPVYALVFLLFDVALIGFFAGVWVIDWRRLRRRKHPHNEPARIEIRIDGFTGVSHGTLFSDGDGGRFFVADRHPDNHNAA